MSKDVTLEANVICDTREQKPWTFELKLPSNLEINCVSQKLDAGDYSLQGYSSPSDSCSIIIERKNSLEEFLGNLGKNWERFQRELYKMSQYNYPFVVIEDDMKSAYARFKTSKRFNFPPEFILKKVAHMEMEHGVTTCFLSNRTMAQKYTANLFKHFLISHG